MPPVCRRPSWPFVENHYYARRHCVTGSTWYIHAHNNTPECDSRMNASSLIRPHQPQLSSLHQILEASLVGLMLYASTQWFGVKWREEYYIAAITSAILFNFFAHHQGLYQSWRSQRIDVEARQLIIAWCLMLLGLLLLAWATKSMTRFSRLAVGSWIIAAPATLITLRRVLRGLLHRLRQHGRNTRAIAIAGAGTLAVQLARTISDNPWMGFRIAGFYTDDAAVGSLPDETLGIAVNGNLQQLGEETRTGRLDEIYIALPMSAEAKMQQLISALGDASIPVHVVPDLFTFNLINARVRNIGGLPVISVYDSPMDSYNTLVKRIEDIVLGSLILLLCALPMLAIAIAIKLDSRGPVLFRQRRYGLSGEEIRVLKFRTMNVTEDGHAIAQATASDPRITRIGLFLRRTSLDELPQFFNVLAGSMSIVGPRPHAVAHNEEYRERIQGYMLRHLVKPGITGWAQVNGWRGETDTLEKMEKRIEHDLYYIRNWSLPLDLKIIVLTVFRGFVHRNAY